MFSRAFFPVTALLALALGCTAEQNLPASCEAVLECCDELTDSDQCRQSYDRASELEDASEADAACQAVLDGAQMLGFCDGQATDGGASSTDTDGSTGGPAAGGECQALESCCQQMMDPSDCLVFVAENRNAENADMLCQDLRQSFLDAGSCAATETDDLACSDGIDNDANGFIDCEDFSCSMGVGITACDGMVENTDALCSDGIDNDDNSFTDCDDFGCSMSSSVTVCGNSTSGDPVPVPEGPEETDEACSDNGDNDQDGFVDCDDFDCSMNPNVTVCEAPPGDPEDTDAACSDNVDNDNDTYVDCDDFDCSMNPNVTVC